MSFRKTSRKIRPNSRKHFPHLSDKDGDPENLTFAASIARTLNEAFGGTRVSIKTVMAYTGAGERTVKNWFEGKNGPNGENLIDLIRHSDEVLETVLLMAERDDILQGKLLVDARDKVAEMIEIIDQLRSQSPDKGEIGDSS